MFKNAYQKGRFITVFYSIGYKPLKIWKSQARDGHCMRVLDEDLNSMVLELLGNNISTCCITAPIPPFHSLGIKMPFITIIMKNMQRYCTFLIEIRDHENQLRRFQASNFQPNTKTNMFSTHMPLRLDAGWNKIELNLADFTHRVYGTRYVETVAIRLNANTRLRRIYFSDQLYEESQKPPEYRLYISNTKSPYLLPGSDNKTAGERDKSEVHSEAENQNEHGMSNQGETLNEAIHSENSSE